MYVDDMTEMWLDNLPRIARPHIDERFKIALSRRFGILANPIATGFDELTALTTCTADEVTLDMVIGRAEELLQDGGLDISWIDVLPRPIVAADCGDRPHPIRQVLGISPDGQPSPATSRGHRVDHLKPQ